MLITVVGVCYCGGSVVTVVTVVTHCGVTVVTGEVTAVGTGVTVVILWWYCSRSEPIGVGLWSYYGRS